jgi:hypothetical protein
MGYGLLLFASTEAQGCLEGFLLPLKSILRIVFWDPKLGVDLLPQLLELVQPLAHIVELKVSSRFRVFILLGVVTKVDSLVVAQILVALLVLSGAIFLAVKISFLVGKIVQISFMVIDEVALSF